MVDASWFHTKWVYHFDSCNLMNGQLDVVVESFNVIIRVYVVVV